MKDAAGDLEFSFFLRCLVNRKALPHEIFLSTADVEPFGGYFAQPSALEVVDVGVSFLVCRQFFASGLVLQWTLDDRVVEFVKDGCDKDVIIITLYRQRKGNHPPLAPSYLKE